jgi:hypothetical protein
MCTTLMYLFQWPLRGRIWFDRAGNTREAIAKEVGISVVSVYRNLRTRKDAERASCTAGHADSDASTSQRI